MSREVVSYQLDFEFSVYTIALSVTCLMISKDFELMISSVENKKNWLRKNKLATKTF